MSDNDHSHWEVAKVVRREDVVNTILRTLMEMEHNPPCSKLPEDFIEEACEFQPSAYIVAKHLDGWFFCYSLERGCMGRGRNVLSRILKGDPRVSYRPKYVRGAKGSLKCWFGIRLRVDAQIYDCIDLLLSRSRDYRPKIPLSVIAEEIEDYPNIMIEDRVSELLYDGHLEGIVFAPSMMIESEVVKVNRMR